MKHTPEELASWIVSNNSLNSAKINRDTETILNEVRREFDAEATEDDIKAAAEYAARLARAKHEASKVVAAEGAAKGQGTAE